MSQRRLSVFISLAILLGGGFLVFILLTSKPEPKRVQEAVYAPPVSVIIARTEDLRLTVNAQGSVEPRREIDLVAQVGGRVVEVPDLFLEGEFFKSGELLVRIDARDYDNAMIRAGAEVASAEQRLAIEQAEAEQALRDWNDLGIEGDPSTLTLRKPQLAEAQAQLDAAKAALSDAKLNLERTQIFVPFDGRVREKAVDIGQFVAAGQRLGTVYSTDVVDIPLPLTDRQVSFLDLPLSPRQEMEPVPVTISATFTGQPITWQGVIRRTQGAIDPRSRVVVAIAEVYDPFNLAEGAQKSKPPLSVGLFVEAEIAGKRYDNIVKVPRVALRDGDQIVLVNAEERLVFTDVNVLRTTSESAYILSGIPEGAQVLTTNIDAPVDGMQVDVTMVDDRPLSRAQTAATSSVGATQ